MEKIAVCCEWFITNEEEISAFKNAISACRNLSGCDVGLDFMRFDFLEDGYKIINIFLFADTQEQMNILKQTIGNYLEFRPCVLTDNIYPDLVVLTDPRNIGSTGGHQIHWHLSRVALHNQLVLAGHTPWAVAIWVLEEINEVVLNEIIKIAQIQDFTIRYLFYDKGGDDAVYFYFKTDAARKMEPALEAIKHHLSIKRWYWIYDNTSHVSALNLNPILRCPQLNQDSIPEFLATLQAHLKYLGN